MTLENLNVHEFMEILEDYESITIQETNIEGTYVTIEDIQSSDPLELVEIMLLAYDSGLHLGAFHADRYGGALTITQ